MSKGCFLLADLSSLGFGSHHGKVDPNYLNLSRQLGELLSQLRLLEERYANLRREHQLVGKNMIDNHNAVRKRQRAIDDEIVSLKHNFSELKQQFSLMLSELEDAAKANDLKIIERYLDFWQPLDFITREEAEKLIEEAVNKSVNKRMNKRVDNGINDGEI